MKKYIYHGSVDIIEQPAYGKGKLYNDYGQGFYCTENEELAKEWACTEGVDGYINLYEIDISELSVLNLSDEKYTILHWLTLLINHRDIRFSNPISKRSALWLNKNYYLDAQKYDIITGYRADDSYFSFARAFLSNQISLQQLEYALKPGKLGEQIVMKSPKAFGRMKFILADTVDNTIYYAKRRKRDEEARSLYLQEIDKLDAEGIYIQDLMRKG